MSEPPAFDREELADVISDRYSPPALPTLAGWEFAGLSRPGMSGTTVSGDWYDAVTLPAGVLLVIGDVMGKGAGAVPDMAQMRTGVRALAQAVSDLGELLMAMDRLHDSSASMQRFATAMLLMIPNHGGVVRIASAGHLRPVLVWPDGRVEILSVPVGPPIGVPAASYGVMEVDVAPGASLLAGSDGVIENRTAVDGVAAAIQAAEAAAGESLPVLLERVAAVGVGSDDLTLLGARRDG